MESSGVSDSRQFLAALISWAGIGVPIILVFVTAIIRSLVRQNKFWSGENLYLGIDLCFAGLAASLVEALDLIREHVLGSDETQFTAILVALALSFCSGIALLIVTKLHQTYEVAPRTKTWGKTKAERDQKAIDESFRTKRRFWLGVASNGIGFATIAIFAWLRARKVV